MRSGNLEEFHVPYLKNQIHRSNPLFCFIYIVMCDLLSTAQNFNITSQISGNPQKACIRPSKLLIVLQDYCLQYLLGYTSSPGQ